MASLIFRDQSMSRKWPPRTRSVGCVAVCLRDDAQRACAEMMLKQNELEHEDDLTHRALASPRRSAAARVRGASRDGIKLQCGFRAGRSAGGGPGKRAPAFLDQAEARRRQAAVRRGSACR